MNRLKSHRKGSAGQTGHASKITTEGSFLVLRWLIYIPAGFAHGLLAITETVQFLYKCSDYYACGSPKLWPTLKPTT
jgi:dTDP-4-dehydrorhamnose 3,5-epimerase-like enzyme